MGADEGCIDHLHVRALSLGRSAPGRRTRLTPTLNVRFWHAIDDAEIGTYSSGSQRTAPRLGRALDVSRRGSLDFQIRSLDNLAPLRGLSLDEFRELVG